MALKQDLGPGHSGRASVLGKAGTRPRGSFLSRSEVGNAALMAWMCSVNKENTETWYMINNSGVMTEFVQILPQT